MYVFFYLKNRKLSKYALYIFLILFQSLINLFINTQGKRCLEEQAFSKIIPEKVIKKSTYYSIFGYI